MMAPDLSVPSPVPGLGHFNQALLGHSCQARRGEKGATVVDRPDDSSSLLGDQDNSDMGHLGWC